MSNIQIVMMMADAVEKRTYGWFWECPNGGDKCQYRHALPEGYVLKRDKDPNAPVDLGPRIEVGSHRGQFRAQLGNIASHFTFVYGCRLRMR